jgi:hypothetical protein
MIPPNVTVQNVLTNVLNVLTCQITVLFVLLEESKLQNVDYQTHLSNPLKSEKLKSVPSELSIVTVDVKHVKEKVVTV